MTASTHTVRPTDPIKQIMRGPVVARVDQGLTLCEVAEELIADEIGAVLVDGPHGPAGVLSERDIITVLANGGDPDVRQAGEVMTPDILWAAPNESISAWRGGCVTRGCGTSRFGTVRPSWEWSRCAMCSRCCSTRRPSCRAPEPPAEALSAGRAGQRLGDPAPATHGIPVPEVPGAALLDGRPDPGYQPAGVIRP